MTKKHEELVEEIADYLQASYAMGQHDYKLGIGYGETPRKWDKDRAEKIIALCKEEELLKEITKGQRP